MTLEAEALNLFESVSLGDGAGTLIGPLLQTELPRLIAQCREGQHPNVCLLQDIGDYLVRVLDITSQLANAIIHGRYIRDHTSKCMSSLVEENDLHTVNYLDEKDAALKSISREISKVANVCKEMWEVTPEVPIAIVQLQHHSELESLPLQEQSPRSPNNSMGPERYISSEIWQSPESTDDVQPAYPLGYDAAQEESAYPVSPQSLEIPSLERLQRRGRGAYTCPHGTSCRKGGVDRDGGLKLFSRNSEFRAHLLRHEKIYKCDLPGCTNTKGFARPDQLERHKQTVKHSAPNWVDETPQIQDERG